MPEYMTAREVIESTNSYWSDREKKLVEMQDQIFAAFLIPALSKLRSGEESNA